MGYGLPAREVHLTASEPQQETPEHQYELHGHMLETVSSAKYLGVTISRDMNWSEHMNSVCTKANKTFGFLKRNLKISSGSRKIKEMAFKSYVHPALEYACTVWDPHSQQHIDRTDAIQRRAARFVMRRYRRTPSASAMIDDLKWTSLQDRRKTARLAMLYRIHNIIATDGIKSKLQPPPPRQRRRHNQQFLQPHCRTQYQQYSFLPRTIRDWNDLHLRGSH